MNRDLRQGENKYTGHLWKREVSEHQIGTLPFGLYIFSAMAELILTLVGAGPVPDVVIVSQINEK